MICAIKFRAKSGHRPTNVWHHTMCKASNNLTKSSGDIVTGTNDALGGKSIFILSI